MVNGQILADALIQGGTAAVAAYGAWRCIQLQKFAADPRLKALAWFFGLFTGAVALLAVWTWNYGIPDVGDFRRMVMRFNGTPPPEGFGVFEPRGEERVNILLAGHHALMLASLAVGVVAFGRKKPAESGMVAAIGLAFVGDLIPAMLALEAGLTLYLAARALINHVEIRSPGALQVAIGFGLFFLGHLLFFLQHRPGYSRNGLGDIVGLVGITLLVQVLPGKK